MITRVAIEVSCDNCEATIQQVVGIVHDDDEMPAVHVMNFERSNWVCPECGHTTWIGDIETIDAEEL